METTGEQDRDRDLDRDRDVQDDDGVEMPPEGVPSPGEVDRANLGQDDVSEQAP